MLFQSNRRIQLSMIALLAIVGISSNSMAGIKVDLDWRSHHSESMAVDESDSVPLPPTSEIRGIDDQGLVASQFSSSFGSSNTIAMIQNMILSDQQMRAAFRISFVLNRGEEFHQELLRPV